MQTPDIIKAMRQHAEDFNLELSTIGQNAVKNRRAYERIKSGTAQIDTVTRVAAWLADDRAKRTAQRQGDC